MTGLDAGCFGVIATAAVPTLDEGSSFSYYQIQVRSLIQSVRN
jgi:hypothetical protein